MNFKEKMERPKLYFRFGRLVLYLLVFFGLWWLFSLIITLFIVLITSDSNTSYNLITYPYKYWYVSILIIFYFILISDYITYKKEIRKYEEYIEDKKHKEKQKELEKKKILAFEEEQRKKGLVKFENKWGTPEQVKKWKEIKFGINKNFHNMSHFQFEEFIAKLFKKMGYKTEVTKKTGDYGIDVIAKKRDNTIAIQCKQNKIGNNVGNTTIQQILGAMWRVKANKSILITTSDFTVHAEEQAKEAPVELWNLNTLKKYVRKYFIDN